MIHDIKIEKGMKGWVGERSLIVSFNLSGNSPEEKFKILKILFNWKESSKIDFCFKKVNDIVTATLKDYSNYDPFEQTSLLNDALKFIKEYKEIDSILYNTSQHHEYIRFLSELFIYADSEQIKNISL